MFGNDHFSGLTIGQQIIPIKLGYKIHNVLTNITLIDDSGRCTVIVVTYEPNDLGTGFAVQDLYYNGAEECFKILTETNYNKSDPWESEYMGITPRIIREGLLNNEYFIKYIESKI